MFLEASTYVERSDAVSSGIAISMLQDSVELYLWTLIKEKDVPATEQDGFVSYIKILPKKGYKIPNIAKLQELNKARVGFKHYGNLPDPSEAVKHQTNVEDFLRKAMKEHFDVNFDDLSLIDLVADKTVRDQLRVAEAKINTGNYDEAADELAKARTMTFALMHKYIPSVDSHGLRETDRTLNAISGNRGIKSFAYLSEYLSVLREAALVAMFRLPHEEYKFLRSSLPSAGQAGAGNWYVYRHGSYTEAVCRRALACIVSICQRLEAGP